MKPALGILLVLAFASCGGGGSGDRRSTFVTQVDALCRDAQRQLSPIEATFIRARDDARAGRVAPSTTFAIFAESLDRASGVSSRLVDRLRRLKPPANERDFHAGLVASLAESVSNVRHQARAARERDANALRALSLEGSRLKSSTKAMVAGHGDLRHCGAGARP